MQIAALIFTLWERREWSIVQLKGESREECLKEPNKTICWLITAFSWFTVTTADDIAVTNINYRQKVESTGSLNIH